MGKRLTSRPLREQALFSLFFFLLMLFMTALLYQSLSNYDVEIASAETSKGRLAGLMQRLDQYNAEYEVRPGNRIVVDNHEARRLMDAGMTLPSFTLQLDRAVQIFLSAVLLLSILLFYFSVRSLFWRLKQELIPVPAATVLQEETAAEGGTEVEAVSKDSGQETTLSAMLFEGEHPQVIAVYLLDLDPQVSAQHLESMPQGQQVSVWERMAQSGACKPQLRTIVAGLFERKAKQLRAKLRPAENMEKLVAIYRHLSQPVRMALLQTLLSGRMDDPLMQILKAESGLNPHSEEA